MRPLEMHFVDYDYAVASAGGELAPEITSRILTLDDAAQAPVHVAVSTSLDRSSFAARDLLLPRDDPEERTLGR